MKLESKIQSEIINYFKKKGYIVVKLILTNTNGIPDLMVLKNGITFFIEVKNEKGKLSELQKLRIEELEKNNFKCYIIRNLNELKNKLIEFPTYENLFNQK